MLHQYFASVDEVDKSHEVPLLYNSVTRLEFLRTKKCDEFMLKLDGFTICSPTRVVFKEEPELIDL